MRERGKPSHVSSNILLWCIGISVLMVKCFRFTVKAFLKGVWYCDSLSDLYDRGRFSRL